MNIFHPPTYSCVGRYVHDDLIDQVIATEVEIAERALETEKGICMTSSLRHLWCKRIADAILQEAKREVEKGEPQLNGFRTVIDKTIAILYAEACASPSLVHRQRSPLPKRFLRACTLFYRCLMAAEDGIQRI